MKTCPGGVTMFLHGLGLSKRNLHSLARFNLSLKDSLNETISYSFDDKITARLPL